jgi:hypothetical protein
MMDDQPILSQSLPNGTPAPVLTYLRGSYSDPNNRIAAATPAWYRDALLVRIDELLEDSDEAAA